MRKILFIITIIIFIILSLLFPQTTISGASNGLLIWFDEIIPTLLPFIILSNIIIQSNVLTTLSISNPKRKNLFPYFLILLSGFLLGMPMGAIMVVHFYKRSLINKSQSEWLLACCNILSPFYIKGFVCDKYLPYITNGSLFLVIYLPAILLSIIMYLKYDSNAADAKKTTSRFHLTFQIIDAGIMNGFEIVTKLGGYIIIFGIIAAYIKKLTMLPSLVQGILLITTEITNGVHYLGNLNLSANITALIILPFVVFGGLCTHAQTYTIVSQTNLSGYQYMIKKLLLSIVAMLILLFMN